MDLSALERDVRALEISLDSMEFWITVSTLLVVVGLVVEYWFPLSELIEEIRKRHPFPWKKLAEMIGGVLVTIGVAGELSFQSIASNKGALIRAYSHQIEGLLNKEAGQARSEASHANERASRNEKEAAQLRKDAESEHIARLELQARYEWRRLTAQQAKALCNDLKPRFANRLYVIATALDPEAWQYGKDLVSAFARCGLLENNMAAGPAGGIIPAPGRFGVLLKIGDVEAVTGKSLRLILQKNGIAVGKMEIIPGAHKGSGNLVLFVCPRP